ncbi:hypothetical protein IAR50_000120 [Cryptococcus sp. DSM 104548]
MKRAAQDMDTRDPKRHKMEHEEKEGEGDKLAELNKRYTQLIMQAALVFQYSVFSRRIGLQSDTAPSHMTRRLELCWRSYDGLRRQVQWDPSMGEKPKCLQVIPPIPLPKSITLASLIPAPAPAPRHSLSQHSPKEIKKDMAEATVKPEPAGVDEIHAPLPLPAHLISDSPAALASTASPIPLGDASTKAFQGQALREAAPILEPPASGQQPQHGAGAGAEAGAGAGSLNYGSMGFNELSSLINGDPSAFGIHLDGVGQSDPGQTQRAQSQQAQGNRDVIDLTSDDDIIPIQAPPPKLSRAPSSTQNAAPKTSTETYQQQQQAANDDLLASLGLGGQDPPGASGTTGTGENVVDFDLGGGGEDFSALAGLFQGGDAGSGGAGGGGQGQNNVPAPTISAQTSAPAQIPAGAPPSLPLPNPQQSAAPPPSAALAEKEAAAEAMGGPLKDLFAEADDLISSIPVQTDRPVAEAQPHGDMYPPPAPAPPQPQAQAQSQPAQNQNQTHQNAPSQSAPSQMSHDPLLGMSLDMSSMGMDMSSLGGSFGNGQDSGMGQDGLNDLSMDPDTGMNMGMGMGMGGDSGYGEMGGIDMNDFNFGGDGGDGANMDGEEFERLMAEFQ